MAEEEQPQQTSTQHKKEGSKELFTDVPTWAWWAMVAGAGVVVLIKLHSSSSTTNPTTVAPVAPDSSTTGTTDLTSPGTSTGGTAGAGGGSSYSPIIIQSPPSADMTALEAELSREQNLVSKDENIMQRLIGELNAAHLSQSTGSNPPPNAPVVPTSPTPTTPPTTTPVAPPIPSNNPTPLPPPSPQMVNSQPSQYTLNFQRTSPAPHQAIIPPIGHPQAEANSMVSIASHPSS